MGGRFSGQRKEEEEQEDDSEQEEEITEKPATQAVETIGKTFAEIAAEAAKKKKRLPAAAEMSAGAQFAKMAAAKKAAAQAPKAKARAEKAARADRADEERLNPQTEEEKAAGAVKAGHAETLLASKYAQGDETVVDDLAKGGEGVIWLALEDSAVRESRDVKSAKQGVVQEGEQCTQTGAWRADATGRVRMPVKAPRGAEGWVTVDSRRCEASDGSFGTQCFQVVADAPEQETEASVTKPEAKQKPSSKPTKAADEIDELLDMFGGDSEESDDDDSGKPANNGRPTFGAKATIRSEGPSAKTLYRQRLAEEARAAQAAGTVAGTVEPNESAATELTDAQKQLRNVRKKLKDIEKMEANLDGLNAEQRKRVERKADLQLEEKEAAAEVKAEQGIETKKKKKPRKTAAKKGDGSMAKSDGGRGGTKRYMFLFFALLPAVALVVAHFARPAMLTSQYWEELLKR